MAWFECAVCHHAIYNPLAPAFGDPDRTCLTCAVISAMPTERQAAVRELMGAPIAAPGTGRIEIWKANPHLSVPREAFDVMTSQEIYAIRAAFDALCAADLTGAP